QPVGGAYAQTRHRPQPERLPHESHEGSVDFEHRLPRTWPSRREVTRQRTAGPAEVYRVNRLARLAERVEHAAGPLHVLVIQAGRVVEVDVRARRAVDQHRPPARVVAVGYQFGGAGIDVVAPGEQLRTGTGVSARAGHNR